MRGALNSIKWRVIIVLLVFLSLSHAMGLWLYAQRGAMTAGLLHDALLADCISAISRLAERTPVADRNETLSSVSGPLLQFSMPDNVRADQQQPEGTRLHFYEHMLSAFLGRSFPQGISVSYSEHHAEELKSLLAAMDSAEHAEISHIPVRPLSEIHSVGTLTTRLQLADGAWFEATSPLLSVSPFSAWKFGAALGAMLTSAFLVAAWALHRWTQPLTYFAAAAERLGSNIKTPPLSEKGPTEVAMAAKAFNRMQDRIRLLVEDRIALAAAIAHDLGTPLTRVRLKVEEIDDPIARTSILQDLDQMQRMVASVIGFARLDLTNEQLEVFDVLSLVERVADDLDPGSGLVNVAATSKPVVRSRPVALQRALTNIVENALKYGERAKVSVIEREGSIEITVDDDGPGVPEELQNEVFTPFRRLPQERNDAVDGTGLGLTVARSLVRGLGGDVTLANRVEGGLRVIISLPSSHETR